MQNIHKTHSLHSTANGEELAAGKHQMIPNAERIFKPDFSQGDAELEKELDNLDLFLRIVSKVEIMSVTATVLAPVVLGLKLFQRPDSTKAASYEDLRITNNSGWLYSCAESKMEHKHRIVSQCYKHLCLYAI